MTDYLAQKAVLIVARRLEEQSQLRALAAEAGAAEILAASSANMAVSLLKAQPFDICLIEHRLGEGEKNGYQVIEEAVSGGLKRAVDACILISPEKSELLAQDSVEVMADTQFLKPINATQFHQRMEKLVKVKRAVEPAEKLIDAGDYAKALKLMDQMQRQMPSLRAYLDRWRGRLLLRLRRWDDAARHFEMVRAEHDLAWSYTGLGICAFHKGDYGEALAHFRALLEKVPGSIEAFDWMSRVYRAVGRNQQAQQALEEAVRILPTAPVLQSGLGNVASENSDWDTAIDAFRSAVKFARHSVHLTHSNYFGLARSLQTRISPGGGVQSASAESEAVRVLEDVASVFAEDPVIRFKSRLMTAETYKRSGDMARANAAAKDAFAAFRSLDDSKQAEELDNLLETVEGTALESTVEEYRNAFNKRVFSETEWGRHNLAGMAAYRKGQFEVALEHFSKALEYVPNSPSVLLNLVQTGYELIRLQPERSGEILALCNEKLLNVSIGAMNSKQQERYRVLSQRRSELTLHALD